VNLQPATATTATAPHTDLQIARTNKDVAGDDFVGVWQADETSILRLVDGQFYLRFGFENGIRENFGIIEEADPAHGHILIRYTKSLLDGRPVEMPSQHGYMTYEIREDGLHKWIGTDPPFPTQVGDEGFKRSPN
jgi:hypothetical protein